MCKSLPVSLSIIIVLALILPPIGNALPHILPMDKVYAQESGTVSITKAVDKATASPGETLSYTISDIGYTGSDLLTNVTVTDAIPAGTIYVADSDTPEATVTPADDGTATLITWNLGSNTAGVQGFAGGTNTTPTLDSTVTTGTASSASSVTFSHTSGSGENRLMLVGVSWNGNQTISSVVWGTTPLALVGTSYKDFRRIAIYSLLAPAKTTTQNVVVTFSGAVDVVAGAATFAGVDQTTPLGTFASAIQSDPNGKTPTVDVPTTANDLVFDTVVIGNYNLTVGANQTQQWNTGSSIRGGASTETASGTSTTMSWTSGGTEYSYWAIGAVPVKPAIDPPRGTTLSASPTLVSTGDVITWTATFTNSNADANIVPGTVTTTGTGGASCANLSGPTLVSADDDISGSGDTVIYRWTCTATAGTTLPSSLTFSVGAAGESYTYPSGTSNSVLVAPNLRFRATVTEVPGINQIDNDATLDDSGSYIAPTNSNTVSTSLHYIGNYVWDDANRDGIQDAGESGLPGVTVRLYDSDDELVASTFTDSFGHYRLPGPATAGQYYLLFELLPGYTYSPKYTGGASTPTGSNTDSDVKAVGYTDTFTWTLGGSTVSIDAGMHLVESCTTSTFEATRDAYISQTYNTTNYGAATVLAADGDSGANESMLMYWDISSIASTRTVRAASITVYVTNPTGSGYGWGYDLYAMNNAWTENGATWNTYDGTNTWTGGAGAAGARLPLNAPVTLGNANAGTEGIYSFDLMPAGITTLQSWVNGTSSNYGFMLWAGASTDGLDFASKENTSYAHPLLTVTHCDPASIDVGDEVWVDKDADGLQDSLGTTEFPAGDIVVRLWSSGPDQISYTADDYIYQTTVATRDLSYGFAGLTTTVGFNKYYIEFVAPAGYEFTIQDAGTDDSIDSDANPTTGRTAEFTYDGTQIRNIDAGFRSIPHCYAVADSTMGSGNDPTDKLIQIDMASGKAYWVITTTTTHVEAGTFNPFATNPTAQMYVLNGPENAPVQFGTYNTTSGAFTVIGSFSSCTTGSITYTNVYDADGLAVDYSTKGAAFYGAIRTNGENGEPPDLLIKINPTTGALMELSPGVTCAPITGYPAGLGDIDDMAIDGNGVLYGIANNTGQEGHVVVIDKVTGAITQDLGPIEVAGTGRYILDVEGFSIDATGQAWVTSGDSGTGNDLDSIWKVDLTTSPTLAARLVARLRGAGTIVGAPNTGAASNSYGDYEAIACYGVQDAPTAITLADFEATPQNKAVLVTWETAMELDHVGFNLYRSTAVAGPYTQLNAGLIPPQFPGEVMGGTYEWLDTDVQPGATYFYKLEDIDVKGVSTFHGPVSTAVVAAPTAVGVRSISACGAITPLALGLTMVLGLLGPLIAYACRRRY